MPELETIRPLKVSAPGASEVKIANRGLNGAYYDRTPEVSASKKVGTIASGETLTVTNKNAVYLLAEKTPVIVDLREIEPTYALAGVIGTSLGWLTATEVAGIDNTGATDSTVGFMKAVEQAEGEKKTLYVPPGEYKVGEGGTGLDFSVLPWPNAVEAGTSIQFELYCAASAKFVGNKALKANPLVRLVAPAGKQFIFCTFKWGKLLNESTEGACIELMGYNDGFLDVVACQKGSFGFIANMPEGPARPCANNHIRIGVIGESTNDGFRTIGKLEAGGNQFSGNIVSIGDIIKCGENGLNLDGATERNTEDNLFHLGAIELNKLYAVADFNGKNMGFVANTNQNHGAAEEAFFIPETAVNLNQPYWRANCSEAHALKGVEPPCDIVNTASAFGKIAGVGVPASGTAKKNTFERAVTAYVAGGGGRALTVSIGPSGTGSVNPQGEPYRIGPNQTITLTYTAAPAAWVEATEYKEKEKVEYLARSYECVKATSKGEKPFNTPAAWKDLGPTAITWNWFGEI